MGTKQNQKIVVIVGPTASGKTSLALEIAKTFDGEVISADSRQVYRGLDIGTEKIQVDEMQGVPHHLIDIVDINEAYSAADFVRDAQNAIADITSRNKLPIVAGGTFFYVDALLGNATLPEVSPNLELRTKLEQQQLDTLYATLLRLDPKRAQEIGPNNKRRIIRALEIIESLGAVPESTPSKTTIYDPLLIGIKIEKDDLRSRIRTRAKAALKRGLIEETKHILNLGYSRDRLTEIGLEYRLVLDYLDEKITTEELIQRLEEKNWQYARRQLTWLKRMDEINWIHPTNSSDIKNMIKTFIQK